MLLKPALVAAEVGCLRTDEILTFIGILGNLGSSVGRSQKVAAGDF